MLLEPGDVDAQEHTAGLERVGDSFQDDVGFGLVVYRVKHRDEVVLRRAVKRRHVLHLERGVRQTQLRGLLLRCGDAVLGEVETSEPAVRELFGHEVDGMALAAPDVAHVDAVPQPVDQPVDERELPADENCVVDLAALLGHQRLERRGSANKARLRLAGSR